MERLTVSKVLFLLFVLIIMFNMSCNTYDPPPGSGKGPDLTFLIPYNFLTEGKLVFYSYSVFSAHIFCFTVYVIDINQQKSWQCFSDEPSISPDGKNILYHPLISTKSGGVSSDDIFVSNIDGLYPVQICDLDGHWPSWTPDGSQILFFTGSSTYYTFHAKYLYRQSPVSNPTDRVLVADFSQSPEQLVPAGPISLSVSGKYVMSCKGIYTFETGGTNYSKIIPLSTDSQYFYSPKWSLDGTKLALISTLKVPKQKLTKFSVISFSADGTQPDTLYNVIYDNGGYFSYEDSNSGLMGDTPSLCWSPDGKQIAFTNELSKIYVVNTDHSGYKLVVDMKGNGFLSWGK